MKKFLLKIWILLALVSTTLCLQSCLPIIFVAGATAGAVAGGVVIYDHRDTKTVMDDRNITYQAQMKLDNDSELQGKVHIAVTAYNYRALLVGQASTAALRDHAVSLVNTVPKIKTVLNEIIIGSPISATTRTKDSWLTAKVKSVLLAEKQLHVAQIKILTEDSVVYLLGLLKKDDGNLAASRASQVDGVKKVIKLFEYTAA